MIRDEDITIRAFRPGDEEAILRCWNEIMPAQDGRPPRDLAYWRWEFEENPHGEKRIAVAALPDGAVVGHYACVPYRGVAEGRDVTLDHAVDLMVLPEYRRALGRPGLIVHLGRFFNGTWCGPDKDLMTYGYPVPVWRIGQKYLGYEIVRDTDLLFRECHAPGFAPRPSSTAALEVVETASAEEVASAADALWAEIAPSTAFGIVRDGRYVVWRYLRHPEIRYTVLLCREKDGGRSRGLAVFRVGDFVVRNAGLCVEWLCPTQDEEAEACLVGALEGMCAARGVSPLAVLLPKADPRFVRFQRLGFLVFPTSYFLAMVTFHYPVIWLRQHWFYSLGETDLA